MIYYNIYYTNLSHNTTQDGFIRKSYKFLIEPHNLHHVKKLLDHSYSFFKFNNDSPNTQKILSTYFDNDLYKSYNERYKKESDSICIRFRTYNDNSEIFYAECKSHKGNSNPISIKERIDLPKNDLFNLLNNRTECNDLSCQLYNKINYNIIINKYKPKVKIIYSRTSYFDNDNDKIRITLDENLHAYKQVCENSILIDVNQCDRIFKFKYSVLELKVPVDRTYLDIDLFKNMIKNKLIIEMPEFSKFMTCMYYFYSDILEIKPYWYDDFINKLEKKTESTYFLDTFNNGFNINQKKTTYPIVIKPTMFTALESLYYKIFNLIIGIPFALHQYDKITNHKSLLLSPIVLKYYFIVCSILNMLVYSNIKNNLANRTINIANTFFPIILGIIFIISLIF